MKGRQHCPQGRALFHFNGIKRILLASNVVLDSWLSISAVVESFTLERPSRLRVLHAASSYSISLILAMATTSSMLKRTWRRRCLLEALLPSALKFRLGFATSFQLRFDHAQQDKDGMKRVADMASF